MGNRAVCEALRLLSYDAIHRTKFDHLLLAAPDIDAQTFEELSSTLLACIIREGVSKVDYGGIRLPQTLMAA
jgi:hypothetical protein